VAIHYRGLSVLGKWLSVQGFREPQPFHVLSFLDESLVMSSYGSPSVGDESSKNYIQLLVSMGSFQQFMQFFLKIVCVLLWVFHHFES
jgi:hypothetical protein